MMPRTIQIRTITTTTRTKTSTKSKRKIKKKRKQESSTLAQTLFTQYMHKLFAKNFVRNG